MKCSTVSGTVITSCRSIVYLLALLFISSCADEPNKLTEFHIYTDEISWDKKGDCSIKIIDSHHTDSAEAKVKFRGGMSSRYEKHSYAVTLWKRKAIDGLPLAKKWILNASYIDKSFMRHKLSYDLWRQMNSDNKSPHCSYVHVYENNRYAGLYILMERMDKHSLLIDSKDSTSFIFKDPPLLVPRSETNNRDSMYLATQKFPKLKKRDASIQLKQLENLIFESNDATFKQEIFSVIDINSFIDWQLIILFTNNGDGQLKNYFIYKQNANTPMKIALWDYDHSFGRDGDNEPNMLERNVTENRTELYKRLTDLNPNNFNEKLAQRWSELRKDVFTKDNLIQLINENDKIIRPNIAKNEEAWPNQAKWYFDDYDAELGVIKEYVSKQLKRLDKRFNHQEK